MRSTALLLCLQLHLAVILTDELAIVTHPRNATGFVDQNHTFNCRAQGDRPISIRWQKKGSSGWIEVQRSSKKHSNLEIDRIRLNDTGYYRCQAENSQGRVTSKEAYLRVGAFPHIVYPPSDRFVPYGTLVSLQCTAVGIPVPYIFWTKNDRPITDEIEVTVTSRFNATKYRFNATETAEYECVASNKHTFGSDPPRKRVKVTVYVPTPKPKPPTGLCQAYNGSVCSRHREGKMVYYNISDLFLNEMIVTNLMSEMISTIPNDECKAVAEKMLCHYAFPDCDIQDRYPYPKSLCREDCLAVKHLFCDGAWSFLENNKERGHFLRNREHFRLPNCSSLDSRHEEIDVCTKVDLFLITEEKVTKECFTGDGRYYIGSVNQTKGGYTCQSWSSQFPHRHLRTPDIFPILQDAGNACRNPGGEEGTPWCFTEDDGLRWEECEVPRCASDITWTDIETDEEDNRGILALPVETILIISAVSVIVVFLIILIAVLLHRIINLRPHNQYDATPQEDLDLDIEQLPNNVSYDKNLSRSLFTNKLEKLEFPRNDIVFLRDIGYGAFGRVFQAKVPHLVKGSDWTVVAVKVLKESASEELSKDFEREASLMVEFNHSNIVKLLAVCAVGNPPCLLFEYMSKGDLNDFLRNCSPDYLLTSRNNEDVSNNAEVPKLDHREQLQIAKQVAGGMVYIADKGYVHRDLATRNCLVGDGLTVKIADFGLTRNLVGDYYKGSEHDAIPIRWMPLEAILYNRFSVKSDVWSYGVVLWEIFSFALQPYYGMTHEEVIKYIQEGETLTMPDNTPDQMYDVMKHCWAVQPVHRPSFAALHKTVSLLLDDHIKRLKKQEKDRDKA